MTKQIPVLLVTGFLGSGKTTFLNWLITKHPKLNISLILNEFGDVKLESLFVKKHSGEIAELANGCMCCVAKSDIPRIVKLILDKSPKTEYLVIEASGLSDPDPIHDALNGPALRDKVFLESVVCIVDALNFEKTRSEHSIVLSQIGDADTVLISKAKEAGEETVTRIKSFIESVMIGVHVLIWDENLDMNMFLNSKKMTVEKAKEENKNDHENKHTHEHYDEYWFKSDKQLDLEKFKPVMNSLPDSVIRSKGYVNIHNKKYLVQYVSGSFTIFEDLWEGKSPHTAILFLGKGLDTEKLEKALIGCEIL